MSKWTRLNFRGLMRCKLNHGLLMLIERPGQLPLNSKNNKYRTCGYAVV